MITARSEPGLQERAFALWRALCAEKPFAAEALIECLERALAKERTVR